MVFSQVFSVLNGIWAAYVGNIYVLVKVKITVKTLPEADCRFYQSFLRLHRLIKRLVFFGFTSQKKDPTTSFLTATYVYWWGLSIEAMYRHQSCPPIDPYK